MGDDRSVTRDRDLAASVMLFELRLQLRSPVFLIVVAIAAAMVLASLTVERIQVGPLRTGSRTGAEAVLAVHLVWSLFFLFTAAAFAAEAALRDDVTGYGPIVRATPATPAALAAGRLGGALGAVLLAFAAVPIAVALAPFAPWAGPLASPDPGAVAYGFVVLALPNLILSTAIFFAFAARARSAMAAYLGAVALLVLYGLGSGDVAVPGWPVAVLDPFGFAAVRLASAGWSGTERAGLLPPVAGVVLANRLVWLSVAAGAVAWATRSRPTRPKPRPTVAVNHHAPASLDPRPVTRRFAARTALRQFAARTGLELRLVGRSPFLAVLLVLGLANVIGTAVQLPPELSRSVVMARVDDAFRLVPLVVCLFWSGELVWGERAVGLDGIVGASPVPGWALLLPKVLTLWLVLAASLGSAALASSGVEAWRTGTADPAEWLGRFALPRTADAGLVAILAVFLQSVAPGKLAGFGLTVLYFIASLGLEVSGFHGDLYRYGGGTATLALDRTGGVHALLVRSYWSAAALLLLVMAQTILARGPQDRLRVRLTRAWRGLGRSEAVLALAALAAMVLIGIVRLAAP